MEKVIGVLGYGEVGKAIASLYPSIRIKDLVNIHPLGSLDILNICIPYTDDFCNIVEGEIRECNPYLTIIHSTVQVGTTEKLCKEFRGKNIVHSPIRGPHPPLGNEICKEALRTFIKFIGYEDDDSGKIGEEHLQSMGFRTYKCKPSKITELGKLLDTTYYGVCIAWHGEMAKLCKEAGVDFKEAVTLFNMTYNEGYKHMGWNHVLRPVLDPPGEKIGRHCVVPNAKLLETFMANPGSEWILKYE